jgi:hypothetical protein
MQQAKYNSWLALTFTNIQTLDIICLNYWNAALYYRKVFLRLRSSLLFYLCKYWNEKIVPGSALQGYLIRLVAWVFHNSNKLKLGQEGMPVSSHCTSFSSLLAASFSPNGYTLQHITFIPSCVSNRRDVNSGYGKLAEELKLMLASQLHYHWTTSMDQGTCKAGSRWASQQFAHLLMSVFWDVALRSLVETDNAVFQKTSSYSQPWEPETS